MIDYRTTLNATEVALMADFAIDGMCADRYPLHVDRSKVIGTIHAVMNGPHFGMAAIDNGVIVGGLAAWVCEMPFFQRCEAHVIMCRATVPGVGRHMINELKAWAMADMKIRRLQFPTEEGADDRIGKLLRRVGFDRPQTNFILYKEPSWQSHSL